MKLKCIIVNVIHKLIIIILTCDRFHMELTRLVSRPYNTEIFGRRGSNFFKLRKKHEAVHEEPKDSLMFKIFSKLEFFSKGVLKSYFQKLRKTTYCLETS